MATKSEISEQLTKLGITHDPNALKADLEALLPAGAETQPEHEAQPAKASDEATAVVVLDPHKHPHRTYSKAVHGDNFRALAEQYVSVRPGWSLK
jgi:hypothetical protein